ncbi:transmembrane protein 268 isoform 1-T4 [Rhinophrynus dorsalis]
MTSEDGSTDPVNNDEISGSRISLHSDLYNGRLLAVLPYSSRAEHMEQCVRKLEDYGIQVPLEKCRESLQVSALIPELSRYVFFTSRGFGVALAVVLYISIWINLYSTAQIFTGGHKWATSILVSLAAAIVTTLVVLIVNRHHKKLNVNTDIRLAAVNELFIEHNVLLGISDRSHKCQSVPSICFIYFHLSGCQRRLSQHLANMTQEAIRRCLDQLFIFIETPANPALARPAPADPTSEETPLLSSDSGEKPLLCSKKIPLIVEGDPQVMAQHLLIISSACYVRLLISGLLPRGYGAGHTGALDVLCPCQFIENSMLSPGQCFTWM